MFRTVVWTLRRPRYAAAAALFFLVAVGCVAAGTWQIARFQQSVRDNDALRTNAHAAAVPLSTGLVPLTGQGAAPGQDMIQFRTITATGTYLPQAQQFLPTPSGHDTYEVVAPLRTDAGVVLVVRGTVAARPDGRPPAVTAPPAGQVRITGRLQTASDSPVRPGPAPGGVITAIAPDAQSTRLGAPVYQAYVTLDAGAPGTAGVHPVPAPDLSNPAGGAFEWQHFAYIIQWYLFALLALIAPFAIARHEVREARRRFLGLDEDEREFDAPDFDEPAARPALPGSTAPVGVLERRGAGTLARAGDIDPERLQRATRLADRYGRSISMGDEPLVPSAPARRGPSGWARRWRGIGEVQSAPRSSASPHRSDDTYHGSYNDYLWQLALADGAIPSDPDSGPAARPPETAERDLRSGNPTPRVIDAAGPDSDEPPTDTGRR